MCFFLRFEIHNLDKFVILYQNISGLAGRNTLLSDFSDRLDDFWVDLILILYS